MAAISWAHEQQGGGLGRLVGDVGDERQELGPCAADGTALIVRHWLAAGERKPPVPADSHAVGLHVRRAQAARQRVRPVAAVHSRDHDDCLRPEQRERRLVGALLRERVVGGVHHG